MNDSTTTAADTTVNPEGDAPTAPAISARVRAACDVATGRVPAALSSAGTRITGAMKDLNARGNGPQWYRMVYRGGAWRYVSDDRLPAGNFLARDRRAQVYGEVHPGEIVVQHGRGAQVDSAWLASAPNAAGKCLVVIDFAKRRSGDLAFKLPDGSELVLTNPRTKS